MRDRHVRAFIAVALALPLGACSSFLGIHFARNTPKAERAEPVSVASAQATEAGRRQLAAGQTGLAIQAFQRALANGEPIAPAVNGLGVAYARLGRDDLAERFFKEAMAADPSDVRYADNLTRLMRSSSYVSRASVAVAAQAMKDGTSLLAETRKDASSAEQPAPGRLKRLSRAEVHITTGALQPAPLRSAVAVDGRFKPIVRIVLAPQDAKAPEPQDHPALAAAELKDFKPVVRFELAEPKANSRPGPKR